MGNLVKGLTWNTDLPKAIDAIAPESPLQPAPKHKPWYTEELREMMRVGRRLERKCQKTRLLSDKTRHRQHLRAYREALRAA